MWTYKQSTGAFLKPDGTLLGYGFAGNGPGLNNPGMEHQSNVGPLPAGLYTMTGWEENDPHTGMCTIILVGDVESYGRSGFRIHGSVNLATAGLDRFLHSSDGCIILSDCVLRRGIWANMDKRLKVIA